MTEDVERQMEKEVESQVGVSEEVDDTDVKSEAQEPSPPPPQDQILMDSGAGLVGWESLDDPENPIHWKMSRKAMMVSFMAIASTISPLASSMVAPAIEDTKRAFHTTGDVVAALSVTIFLLGYCIGPLLLGPLSELYGRRPVAVLSNWFFFVCLIGCGLANNMIALISMRLLAGIGGAGSMTLAPAVCADMFVVEQRGRGTSVVLLGQCIGPTIGPLMGSFITAKLGWRWNYWILAIMVGAVTAAMTLFMKESYPPVLLKRKAERLRRLTGRSDLRPLLSKDLTKGKLIANSLSRPFKLLTRSPATILVCLYLATMYGIMYLWFTTYPDIFEHNYHWDPQLTGLSYLGMGIGQIVALIIIMHTNDATIKRLTIKNKDVYEPEFRLRRTIYYAALIPISLLWFGWSAQVHAHWIVPSIASFFFGLGLVGFYVPLQQYVIDAFGLYAASAIAAVRTSVSFVGVLLPLAGKPMFDRLGLGWGHSVLGLIALLLTPVPLLFQLKGKMVRDRWPVTL